jgi:cytochrome P450
MEIDIVQATLLIYAKIIMTICVGVEHAGKKVMIERDDGRMESIPVAQGIDLCYQFSLSRGRFVINQLFPSLKYFTIMPSDRRFGRNVVRVRAAM